MKHHQCWRTLGRGLALAILPCVLLIFLLAKAYPLPFEGATPMQSLDVNQHEHNATLREIQHAVDALTKEAGVMSDMKIQLKAAVAQLKAAQETLTATAAAAQSSVTVPAATAKVHRVENGLNELREWFARYTTGPGADKWSGYLDAYHRHFDRFRAQGRITLVEVGVQSGGSIEMWRSYFGADKLNYIGVDVNPKCKQFEKEGVRIVLGDQSDPAFWTGFKANFPEALDIFIDDGGHSMDQQIVTLEEMFWHVRDGGIYLCEDMHTSYWPDWGGGYRNNDTMIERSKALVDTINAWHSRDDRLQVDQWARNIRGLHFYDSMVFIDKAETGAMERLKSGDHWIPYRRRSLSGIVGE